MEALITHGMSRLYLIVVDQLESKRKKNAFTWKHVTIGHFRMSFGLFFKASPGAHPFMWTLAFIHMQMKTNFHMKGWAPRLALKTRPKVIRKWPIGWAFLWFCDLYELAAEMTSQWLFSFHRRKTKSLGDPETGNRDGRKKPWYRFSMFLEKGLLFPHCIMWDEPSFAYCVVSFRVCYEILFCQ